MRSYIEELYNKKIKFTFSCNIDGTDETKCVPTRDFIKFYENYLVLTRINGDSKKYFYKDICEVTEWGEFALEKDRINRQKIYKLPTR